MTKFRVKELARERGMTTDDLARTANLKISTVRNIWQNRVSDPSFSTLTALARALNVRIEELVDNSAPVGVNSADIGMPLSVAA